VVRLLDTCMAEAWVGGQDTCEHPAAGVDMGG